MSESTVNEAGNGGGSVTVALPKVSEREMMALNALAGIDEDHYLNFKSIASRSRLDPKYVRRSVRALARKGLAEYGKGLWSEDGEVAGAGYRATAVGRQVASNPNYEDYWE